jgi:hypothetical protein
MADTLSRAGAEELAARIRNYWREKGREVRVWIESQPAIRKDSPRLIWTVRSEVKVGVRAA